MSGVPRPVARELSKPTRIYADVYGDPHARTHVPIAEVMTRAPLCVGEQLSVRALAALFRERQLEGVPVVDEDQRLIGFVRRSDLVSGAPAEARVGELRTRKALALPEWTPLSKAAALMAFEGVELVPVVSSERVVVGLLSGMDVLRWLARSDGYVMPPSVKVR